MVIPKDTITMTRIPSNCFNNSKKWNDVQQNTLCSSRCFHCNANRNKPIRRIILQASSKTEKAFQFTCPRSKTSINL
jgi:hypothetical protein